MRKIPMRRIPMTCHPEGDTSESLSQSLSQRVRERVEYREATHLQKELIEIWVLVFGICQFT